MASKITIELGYDVENEDQEVALHNAARVTAKHLQAITMLLCKRPPEVVMFSNSFFEQRKEISLAEDMELDEHG